MQKYIEIIAHVYTRIDAYMVMLIVYRMEVSWLDARVLEYV